MADFDSDEEEFASPPSSPPPPESLKDSDAVTDAMLKNIDQISKEGEDVSAREINNYANIIGKLPDDLIKSNYSALKKDLFQLKKDLKITDPKSKLFNLYKDTERLLQNRYLELNPRKRKQKQPAGEINDNSKKKRELSIFEKLRLNTKSILNIKTQSNVLINGITKSGKSTFISNMFSPEYWSFADNIENVYLFSKINVQEAWTNLQRNCESLGIKLHVYQSIDTLPDLQKVIPKQSVLIVDDFMVDAIKDKKLMNLLTDLFNVTTHHNDIISIFTLHNLFADGFRTIRLNSDFIFLFSNPVDINSIKTFFRQLENESKAQLLFIAYKRALENNKSFGIKIMKNLDHEFFYGFKYLIMFVTDDELSQMQKEYKLTNDGMST